jgi:predicted amidophosphoribosyltransferase
MKQRQIMALPALPIPVSIVPSPNQKGTCADHAFYLALGLSQLTGWPIKNILTFQQVEVGSQKQKRATERRDRKFKLATGTKVPRGTLIFIDDVVTTGSTVEAAWRALGKPSQFEVWCLAYQPMLAAKVQV